MKRRTLIVGLGSLAALQSRIQAAAFKDLDRAILRRLRERGAGSDSEVVRPFAARGPKTREGVGLKSGALLVREWKGRNASFLSADFLASKPGKHWLSPPK